MRPLLICTTAPLLLGLLLAPGPASAAEPHSRPAALRASSPAFPQTITAPLHLRWNECVGGPNASRTAGFTCDTNAGFEALVLSYAPNEAVRSIVGLEADVDIGGAGNPLPSWWEISSATPSCRQNLGSIEAHPDPSWTCASHWRGAQQLGVFAITSWPYASARIRIAVAQSDSTFDLGPSDGEVFVATLRIAHVRTVGTPSCAGCQAPLCLAFDELTLVPPSPAEIATKYYPQSLEDSQVAWRDGALGTSGCGIVPARNRTWGAIKSMYR